MKKIVILFLVLVCSACSKARDPSALEEWMGENGKVKILSSTRMIDDLVGRIGGDCVDHIALIVGDVDPHSYELVKGDAEKLDRADLIFYNGLGLEHGASLAYRLTNQENTLALGSFIEKEQLLWIDGAVDPHIWMDVNLFISVVDPIVSALAKLLPEERAFFEERAKELKDDLLKADAEIYRTMQAIPEKRRYLITSHDAFNYFTRRYMAEGDERWEKRFAAPEGLAPDGQLSHRDIQAIIDHLKEYEIRTLFPESNVSQDSIKKIVSACRSAGIEVELAAPALYGDAMGPQGSSGDSYIKMMKHNAALITHYL